VAMDSGVQLIWRIEEGTFQAEPALLAFIDTLSANGGTAHFNGVASDWRRGTGISCICCCGGKRIGRGGPCRYVIHALPMGAECCAGLRKGLHHRFG